MLKYEFNKKEKSRGLLKILIFKIEGREKSNKWEPMGHGTSRDGPGVSRELVETLSLRRCSDRWVLTCSAGPSARAGGSSRSGQKGSHRWKSRQQAGRWRQRVGQNGVKTNQGEEVKKAQI